MPLTQDILIVDDDVAIVEFMTEALAEEGYSVRSISEVSCALHQIAIAPPALVLLDLHLQDLSGQELLDQLHNQGTAAMPIVVMTADLTAARQLAAEDSLACLLKPFDLDALYELVARYLPPQCTPGQ